MTPSPDLSKLRIDRRQSKSADGDPPIGWNRKPILAMIVALLLGVIVFSFLRSPNPSPITPIPNVIENRSAPEGSSSLERSPIVPLNGAQDGILNATGYVVAQRKAAVSSKATGRLKELKVVEGDKVEQGDVIGTLENDDVAAIVRAEEAAVVAAQAELNSAQAELSVATIDRDRKISMQRSKASSELDRDNAVARYQKAQAMVELARAKLNAAQAQLDKARIDLEYTFIHAPFAGTVLTKNADVGEIVAPFGSSADARAAVVTIADMASLQVEADISESNITRVFLGQPVAITLDSFPGKTYRGVVDKIVPTVDRAKATVLVKIKFAQLDQHVLPEMSAKVALEVKKKDE